MSTERRRGKRQDILDAAIALMGREGPQGLTAGALAREAGVSKANIFHHFASVHEVALAAFEHLVNGLATLDPPAETDFRGWLTELGDEITALVESRSLLTTAYLAFSTTAMFDPEMRRRLAASLATTRARLVTIIAGLHRPVPAPDDAEALADLILMTMDGLGLHLMTAPDRAATSRRAWGLLVERLAASST